MHSARGLCEELMAIQVALAEDAFERLPQMLDAYHLHLGRWMLAGVGSDMAPVRELRDLHWQTLAQLQQRQQHLRRKMQAGHHGNRAARAYLSGVPG